VRILRIEYLGALCKTTNRGKLWVDICANYYNRHIFLLCLGEVLQENRLSDPKSTIGKDVWIQLNITSDVLILILALSRISFLIIKEVIIPKGKEYIAMK